jgi:hypothetical protein
LQELPKKEYYVVTLARPTGKSGSGQTKTQMGLADDVKPGRKYQQIEAPLIAKSIKG